MRLHAHRPRCRDGEHVPGCYNPQLGQTWCLCGRLRWPGSRETMHWEPVRPDVRSEQVLGYRWWRMPACGPVVEGPPSRHALVGDDGRAR